MRPLSTSPLPAIRRGSDFVADANLALPAEVVRGLLHRKTKAILCGSSKVGKTNILLDCCLSVASGLPFFGWDTVGGRVLLINLELDEAFFQQRVRAIQQRKGIASVENLEVWNLRGVEVTSGMLLGNLRTLEDAQYSLIVIDPVYKLMTGRSEASGSNISRLGQDISNLINLTGAAVLYGHHSCKGNQTKKRAIDRLGGSKVFGQDADTIITLTEHEQAECFTVEVEARNLAPVEKFVVEWEYPVMELRPTFNPDALRERPPTAPTPNEVITVHRLLHRSMTTEAWRAMAIESGISGANFRLILEILEGSGQVQPEGANSWRIRPAVPTPAQTAPPAEPWYSNHEARVARNRHYRPRQPTRNPERELPNVETPAPPMDPDERPIEMNEL